MCQFGPGLNGPTAPTAVAFTPFISQIAAWPLVFCHKMSDVPLSFCHRMSDLLSPLKSPVALMCQVGPGLNEPAGLLDSTVEPFISQIAGVPSSFCHRMSDLPSPLKSPLSLTCQLGPGLNEPAA